MPTTKLRKVVERHLHKGANIQENIVDRTFIECWNIGTFPRLGGGRGSKSYPDGNGDTYYISKDGQRIVATVEPIQPRLFRGPGWSTITWGPQRPKATDIIYTVGDDRHPVFLQEALLTFLNKQ